MKKIICCVAVLFMLSGCASFGKWSPEVQTKLDAFGTWADLWVGGALNNAPLIIAAVSMYTGQTIEIVAAQAAVKAAQSALGSYHAIVATGSGDSATAEATLIKALAKINETVGKIKDIAATLNVPLPAPVK
jgi:hypothetical protein